ncbi:regulator of microtubule dynamics protein 3-like [Schistocerca gregaria]|uniref:regulator of microtubule dynamics protein 3-like n=1 Tax=Schistocerca gregaria TaxID=7010 RepID=UPI00211EA7D8|nr:regulator of microtubule dynamics protein 3-like [Schistocerca gregaria]
MVNDAMFYRGLIALAMGLGVALGAVSFFIIEQFSTKRRLAVEHDVHRLATDIDDLRYEVQQLREAGGKKNKSGKRNARSISSRSTTSDGTSDVELLSAIGSTEDDEEFFDFSDNESETGDSELTNLLREVDGLLRGSADQQQTAFYLLEQHYNQYSEEPEVLWRLAQASHALTATMEDAVTPERKKSIIQKGCEHAERAVKLNPSSYEAHKWYAISVGTRGQLSGLKERISDGILFKKHIDEALKLKPNDGSLHHLLGRFNFEVASRPWMERSMASTLFGLPSVSIEDALEHFLKAERLTKTPWKENRLFIARCYDALGNTPATVEWLEKADVVESITLGDEDAEKALHDLSIKYESHLRNRRKRE